VVEASTGQAACAAGAIARTASAVARERIEIAA
jgi:hypothetical protein